MPTNHDVRPANLTLTASALTEKLTYTTLYRLPKSRLERERQQLDWIDDYESTTVDREFCGWLADYYNLHSPFTNELVAADLDANICLYRWNASFANAVTGGDPDAFDGMIGGDSSHESVACYDTWMTQRQAWQMWAFFRSSIRDGDVIVELRSEYKPKTGRTNG